MLKVSGLLFVYFLSGFWLNYNVIKEKTIKMPSYLTGCVFIILALPLVNFTSSWQVALSILCLVCIYIEIIGMKSVAASKRRIFKIGFFLGCLMLFDYTFFLGYPFVCGALIYYSQFSWRHFIIQLIGLLYPLGGWAIIFGSFKLNELTPINETQVYQGVYWMVILCFFLLLSLKELYHNYYKKSEQSKKAFNVLLVICILVFLYSLLFNTLQFVYILILPFTIIIANYLIYMKHTKFRTFLLGLLIITFMLKFLNP
tara:strand:- start:117 stop:887 length:771 start_codon:yes stop_codon:yes gene_type:complete